jgi:hypothetical protein
LRSDSGIWLGRVMPGMAGKSMRAAGSLLSTV